MQDKICYYENKIADKLLDSVAENVIYKETIKFPIIQIWNKYTEEVPSIRKSSDGFKKYYLSKVVDQDVLNDLEDEKIINAVPNLAKLYPIITPSDGNCLCHAVSQYLWGIPDRRNFLRQLLYVTMVSDEDKLLQRLYMQHVANEQFSEENFNTGIWNKQWDRLVMEAQEIPKNFGNTHVEPLEAIHIFILANILLRPIIVLSSPVVRTVFNETIQSNNIGGIYLPLLCNPNDTEKSPIVLGFHMNHFTPLIYMENSIQIKEIPLKRMEMVILPLHFSQDLLPNSIAIKLQAYLNIDRKTESVLIKQVPLPKDINIFSAHFEHCKTLYDNVIQSIVGKETVRANDQMGANKWSEEFSERHSETIHIISSNLSKDPSFCINNCGMYGAAELGNKCSKCFAEHSKSSDRIPKRNAKQEVRARSEDVFGQNTHEQFQFDPAKMYEFHYVQKKLSDRVPQSHTKEDVRAIHKDPFVQNTHEQLQFAPAKEYELQFPQEKVSDRVPQRHANQEVRARYDDEFDPNTHKQYLLAPAKEYKPSVFQLSEKTLDISTQEYKHKPPQYFLYSRNDSNTTESKESQDESTQFIPIPGLMHQQPEESKLMTATCITPGCIKTAHRKLQYRCGACFIERNQQSKGTAFVKNDPKTVHNSSQLSENSLAMLSREGAIANTANLSPIKRTEIPKQDPSVSTERHVSLLDLLCTEDNCPNRRKSPFHKMCPSCLEKNGKLYCSSPGCNNEQQQNRLAMCNDCFRKNELERQKIQTQINTINHIPQSESYNTKHERKICDKPTCINSRGPHSTGYCIKCFMHIEKSEHPKPSAPSFHK